MNFLLGKTDKLIHNTIKAEIRRTVGKTETKEATLS